MKKLFSILLLVCIAIAAQAQHEKIITLKTECCVYDLGGTFTKPEPRAAKIYLYKDQMKMKYLDRTIPRVISLRGYQTNTGECDELDKYVVYQWVIDKTYQPDRYLKLYYSIPDSCYYLQVEHRKYAEHWRIL